MGQASSSLPDDVTSEILLRLPADSIGRLRCVSKSFLSLTTDPHFIRTHSSISTTSPVGFYFSPIGGHQAAFFHLSPSSPPPPSDPSLSFLDYKGHPAQIMHSCNGLVLCRLPDPFIEQQRLISLLSVCNPTTREHDVIPVPENLRLGFRFSLAFDPSLSLHFGIVAMRRLRERNAYCMHRFSSETRSWKLANGGIPGDLFYHWDTQSIFCNGALCWKALDGFTCFDLGTEKFNHIRLPAELLMIPSDYVYCGGSGGRLQCLKTCGNAAGPRFKNSRLDIFETEPKSSSEWSLLYSVDLGGMVDEYPEAEGEVHLEMMVLWFCHGGGGEGGDEVGDRLVLSTRTKIVAYHFKTRKFSTICSGIPSDMGMYRHRWRCVYPQANTLVPLNASTTPQQDWVCWKSGHDKLLVSLMVEDSLSRREHKLNFTNAAWDDMVKKFNGATKLNYEVDHLKNRLKSYTRDYKIISRMLRRRCSSQNPVPQIASSCGLIRIRHRNDEQRWTLFLHQRERITFEYLRIIHTSSLTSHQEISSTTSADVEKSAEEDVSNNDHTGSSASTRASSGTVGNQDVHSVPMIESGESSQDTQGTLPLKRKMM